MKVSYNWLQEYFEETLPKPEALGDLLTFHAFEIEDIEKVNDDHVIDVDILPNRSSDCMSHRGIAREIATLLGQDMKYDPLDGETLEVDESNEFKVEVENTDLCSRYAIAVIEKVKIGPSPEWLQKALETLGQRSINNVVDATNYVMLNTGQPLHAFDAEKLQGGDHKLIRVRNAKEGEKITTLTGDEYELDPSTLLITDGNSGAPIGIAGVKGGKVAEVDDSTVDVVIESAHFNFANVRKTSQKLKLWTDASTRFQNNPSQHLVGYALADVVELILDIAGGEVEGAVDVFQEESEKEVVTVTLSQINNLLGTKLTSEQVTDILNKFSFEYETDGELFTVTPPFERTDIQISEDLIEEVGRVHGYEHLEAKQLPNIGIQPAVHKEFYFADRVRNILVCLGYSEVLRYSFRDKGVYEAITAVASDKSFLRTNLYDGLKESLEINHKNAPLFGLDRVKIFEIGRVFPKEGERVSLALGVSGKKTDKILNVAKKTLEKELSITISDLPKEGVLEINFERMIEPLTPGDSYESFEKGITPFKPISLYPFMLRDISLWVSNDVSEVKLSDIITEKAGELMVRKTMFDEFEKNGRTSYAYHLVFQSDNRTLTDEEINKIMIEMTSHLNSQDGFEVR